jgi:hypothetical protein
MRGGFLNTTKESFMYRTLFAALVAVGGIAVALPASAFGPPLKACRADVASLCPDAHGPRAVHACLRDNQDQLSADCAAELQQMRARREACRGDVQTLCPDAEGPREAMHCLFDNQDKLSDACRTAMAEPLQHMATCRAEIQALCPNAQSHKEVRQCLHDNGAQLSEECRPPHHHCSHGAAS